MPLGAEVSFSREIRPILSDHCFKCHGPDAKNQESEYRLDNQENAHADLGNYFGIVPGAPERSELITRIHSNDESLVMPPPDAHLKLTNEEKKLLEKWIREGAEYEPHWSFVPPAATVPVPAGSSGWPRNEIDRFIDARLADAGLGPADEASREKWLRRVTFDLTGLPPTPAAIRAFLADREPGAHERVIDSLFDSTAHAERMASEWLDLARYSDSYGYQRDEERLAWPWRDWVISAFRENMPYDRFVTLQLAGDLLPDAGPAEVLPTAFNRLHGHVMEGGIVLEEYRVEYVADRTNTFGTAFLGLTMECSRCHDHKYDPLPIRDYYSLGSFFANIDESGLISYFTETAPTPAMPLSNPEADQRLAMAGQAVERLAAELDELAEDDTLNAAFEAWLEKRGTLDWPGLLAHVPFDSLEDGKLENRAKPDHPATTKGGNRLMEGKFGKAIEFAGDDPTVVPDVAHFDREQPFSVSVWIRPDTLHPRENVFSRSAGADDAAGNGYEFLLINGHPTASLSHFWPGNAIRVQATEPLPAGEWSHVLMTYDGSSRAAGLRLHVNGRLADTRVIKDHLTRSISTWRRIPEDSHRQHFIVGQRYRDRGFVKGRMDELRIFDRALTAAEARQLHDGTFLDRLLKTPAANLTGTERAMLHEYFLATRSSRARSLRTRLLAARLSWNETMDSLPSISVMRELPEPRPAYILERGAYDAHGEEVVADTPGTLPPFPRDQPRNRLGLARWLTDPDHPLTARVAVNRYWQLMFGRGIVRTPEDFGSQGKVPTHPGLLDWLARDFIDHGWDVRHLLRQIALSATYRQDTVVDPAVREKDPENLLYSRSDPRRLSGEMVRDNLLAVSGLLVDQVGGPPTRPYELEVSFEPVEAGPGDDVYRRSLYTRWKRNAPPPVMVTFGVPKRDVCSVKRIDTSSPLQALVALNGPQFIEASRVLAASLLEKHGDDSVAAIAEAFLLLTSREPEPEELEILDGLHQQQVTGYREDPGEADALLSTGREPVPPGANRPELASMALIVNAVMNLNEALSH